MLIEVPVDQAVHWMSPYDADEKLFQSIQKDAHASRQKGYHVAMADARVLFFDLDVSPEDRHAMITIAAEDRAKYLEEIDSR